MSEQGEPGLLREGETAGKAAVDKMAHDMGVELRAHGVAVVSIWGIEASDPEVGIAADLEGYGVTTADIEAWGAGADSLHSFFFIVCCCVGLFKSAVCGGGRWKLF